MVSQGLSQGWQEAGGTGPRALSGGWALRTASGGTTPTFRRGAAQFLVMAALAGVLLMGAGCSASWFTSDKNGASGELRVRQPAMETTRLLQNAHYYKLMGRPEASLKEMEQAHRQDPDNLKIVDTLAQTYQELGQFQRAQELYQEALARQGSNRVLQNNWCFSFYLQGDLAKAESCFKEALARDPGNAAARNNLGLLWCRQGKLVEAQRLWEETEGTGAAQNRLNQALAFLGKSPPAHYAKATESKAASPTQATAPQKPVVPVTPVSPAKPVVAKAKAPVKAPGPVQPVAAPPKAELQPAAKPATRPAPLTVAARAAGIEVRNGTRTKNLAHLTRALLSQEGFNVTQIGNHIDFGAGATVIYYRAGAEKLARTLNLEIFPEAKLEQSARLNNGVAIKVLLGQDLLNQPRVMTRLTGEKLAESPPAVNAKALAAGPQPQSAASKEPAAPVIVAAPAKAGPDKPQIQAVALAARPTAKNQASAETTTPKGPLTAAELMATLIEIRNGTRSQNLAHQARSLLSREGFSVGIIGNHIDFGAETTVIYYRAGAEKVARALNSEIFPGAQLTPSSRLNQGMAIKVVLGRDLLDRPQLMSRLAEE